MDIEASAPQPQDTTTNTTTKPKRKQGDRKANQYPDKACYVITEVGLVGEILEPQELRGRFHNAIRALVKALVWFWCIDETLSANLVYQVIVR